MSFKQIYRKGYIKISISSKGKEVPRKKETEFEILRSWGARTSQSQTQGGGTSGIQKQDHPIGRWRQEPDRALQ